MTPSRRHVAALAAAIALAVGAALLTTGGSGPRADVTPRAITRSRDVFPRTPAGAVAAATAWCQDTGQAFFTGTWDTAVRALATRAFRARADRLQPASEMVHSRLIAAPSPAYVARSWPLGYAVEQYSPTSARVRVWQLFVLEIATPNDVKGYQSTTVSLQWTEGDWKIAGAARGPDLTPPGSNATADQVASWISAVDHLDSYAYAP